MIGTYAVNVADLTKDGILAQFLVAPVIPDRQIVKAEPGKIDGGAVLLQTDEERASAIVETIRLKWPKHALRCYRRKTDSAKTWARV